MHTEFNAQSAESFELPKKINDHQMVTNPSLAADGFDNWWQKTAAQNIAMVTEATALMRAHRIVNSARHLRGRQAD
jgi:hypothetical protein